MLLALARDEGLTGLARGLMPRLISTVPTSAIAFSFYEYVGARRYLVAWCGMPIVRGRFTKRLSMIDAPAPE